MTLFLRTVLRVASGALLAGLCLATQAAPQHAITLYDEPPKYPANFKHFDYVNPDAPKGGTLRLAGAGGFDSLNMFISKGVSADQLGLLYDTLTYHSPDEPFTEYGLLAEKIEKAPDDSYVRFFLNPKAKFNDGTPVTADDVIFSFETLRKKGAPTYAMYYSDVSQVVAEAPLTVRFDFTKPGNRELPLIIGQLPVLPKHWWATRDFGKANLEVPLGSGPYRITNVSPGSSIRFERNKDWWGKDLPVNRGYYNFDVIQVDYYRDTAVTLEAFKAGQYDFNLEYSAKDWATGYDSPALRDGRIIKEAIPNQNSVGMQSFAFNIRRAKFQDPRVREAISLLFDFEWSNKQLFFGAYKRNSSFFENSDMAAHEMPDAEELKLLEPLRGKVPDKVFTEVFKPPVSNGDGMIREQKRKAYKLLLDAGYKIENDKMVGPDGQPLTIEFMLYQLNLERVLLPFMRNLAELGIDMQIRRVDASQYVNRMRSRDFDMTTATWGQSNSPGNEQREYWHSSSADSAGSRNYIGLRDPAIDVLVDGLIRADSRNSLKTHARALDRVLLWGNYVIPNYYIDTFRIAHWNKFGRPAITPKYDFAMMTWWQSSEKALSNKPQAAADVATPADPTENQ